MSVRRRLRDLRKHIRHFDRRHRLAFFLLRNRRTSPNELFREAWRIVEGAPSKRGIEERFGVPARHIRHFRLRQVVKFFVPKFSPEVRFNETFFRHAFNAPSVVACIHSRTEFAICAALDRAGLQTAFVSADPVSRTQLENYNFSIPPLNILRRPELFVKARAALKSGKIVVCDADFILNKGLPNAQVCISKSLFEFRRMSGANLFFGYVQISEDGGMDCIIEAVPQRSASAHEDAEYFIDFLARFEGTPPQLTVREWPAPAQG